MTAQLLWLLTKGGSVLLYLEGTLKVLELNLQGIRGISVGEEWKVGHCAAILSGVVAEF